MTCFQGGGKKGSDGSVSVPGDDEIYSAVSPRISILASAYEIGYYRASIVKTIKKNFERQKEYFLRERQEKQHSSVVASYQVE